MYFRSPLTLDLHLLFGKLEVEEVIIDRHRNMG